MKNFTTVIKSFAPRVIACLVLLMLCFVVKVSAGSLSANPIIKNPYNKTRGSLLTHSGFEISFGSKSAHLTSEKISQLHNSNLIKGGGTLGFYFGNDYVKFPVRIGLYTEAIKDDYSTDFYEASFDANINLLKIAGISTGRVSTYAIVGLSHSSTTFSGTYVSPELRQPSGNRMEPLIGKVQNNYLNTGWGMEYILTRGYEHISVFMEAKSLSSLSEKSDYAVLENTHIAKNLTFSFGVRIGAFRR